jgi:hypothetical protein
MSRPVLPLFFRPGKGGSAPFSVFVGEVAFPEQDFFLSGEAASLTPKNVYQRTNAAFLAPNFPASSPSL